MTRLRAETALRRTGTDYTDLLGLKTSENCCNQCAIIFINLLFKNGL